MRPARKRLALTAMATAVTTATVAAAFAAPAAHAASLTTVVREHKWVGGCEAILYTNSNVPVQASAGVYFSTQPGITMSCTGWLERRYGDGTWSVISGYHHLTYPGASGYTGWYDDSGTGQARACVTAFFLDEPSQTDCTTPW